MNRTLKLLLLVGTALALLLPAAGAAKDARPARGRRDRAAYRPAYEDPVLKELEERAKAAGEKEDEATDAVREEQKAKRDAERKSAQELRFDMSGIVRPDGPAAFRQVFHFPPVAQFNTGTCWSFSTTSFFESEIARLTGRRIKLSEIHTVYWEYVEKMRRFVTERGDMEIAEGSESGALKRIWPRYGVVPGEVYSGLPAGETRHDHSRLVGRLQELGAFIRQNDLWDEALVDSLTRAILDRELGRPPDRFTWEGGAYTPLEFYQRVVRLNLDDYVEFMSTLAAPFYTRAEYKYPDNWWHDQSYGNVPLDEWYGALRSAVSAGYTLALGGDVSEPGMNGFESMAVIPSFDIPAEYIDQDSRELRIENRTTDDDHGVHVVGIAQAGGHDWFLVKDSNRSSRWGAWPGYYFYRDDYLHLKVLSFMVHRDAVKELLARFPGEAR